MNNIVPATNVTVIEPSKAAQTSQSSQIDEIGSKLAEARGAANPSSLGEGIKQIGQELASNLPIFSQQVSTETIATNSWQSLGAVLS
ncbi:MAG: hypothetical protein OXU45_01300 [Candidatus Melainabacteria bacterium]|nr:hypothetical protein [Candidatus Melainabacteria bacterium]